MALVVMIAATAVSTLIRIVVGSAHQTLNCWSLTSHPCLYLVVQCFGEYQPARIQAGGKVNGVMNHPSPGLGRPGGGTSLPVG